MRPWTADNRFMVPILRILYANGRFYYLFAVSFLSIRSLICLPSLDSDLDLIKSDGCPRFFQVLI